MVRSLNSTANLKPLPGAYSDHALTFKKINSLTPATDPDVAGQTNRRNRADSFGSASDSSAESLSESFGSTDFFSSSKGSPASSVKSSRQGVCSLRNVNAEDVRQVLIRLGFKDRAQKGSHHNLVSPNTHYSVTVPDHGARHPLAAGTLNSILNDVEDILKKEVAVLPESKAPLFFCKEDLRAWFSDPKGCRQEIKDLAQRLVKHAL